MASSQRVDLALFAGEDGSQLWRWLLLILLMLIFLPSASASVNDALESLGKAQDKLRGDAATLTISQCNMTAVNDLLSHAVSSLTEGKYNDALALMNTAKANLSDCNDALTSSNLNASQASLDISGASKDIDDAVKALSG